MRDEPKRARRPKQAHRAPIHRSHRSKAKLAGGFGLRVTAHIFRPRTYTRMVELFGDLQRHGGRPSSAPLVKAEWQRRRAAGEPLLLDPDGRAWGYGRTPRHAPLLRQALERARLDPTVGTYAFRHSSIVRQLQGRVPVSIVAQLHDTSSKQIEAHYARYISHVSDHQVRPALLEAPAVRLLPPPERS